MTHDLLELADWLQGAGCTHVAMERTGVYWKPIYNILEEQRELIAFRSHHLFESSFCRPGEAHEKGMVENLVEYVRRNFLVPLPSVSSFEELNAILQDRCTWNTPEYRDALLRCQLGVSGQKLALCLPSFARVLANNYWIGSLREGKPLHLRFTTHVAESGWAGIYR